MIFRLLRHQRNYRYIDKLQDLVNVYNHSQHRSLHGLSPSEVTRKNESRCLCFSVFRTEISEENSNNLQIQNWRFSSVKLFEAPISKYLSAAIYHGGIWNKKTD